jgi:hypothetical protein
MRALVKRIIIETSLSNSNTPERATIEFGKPVSCLTGRGATKMALLSRLALDPAASVLHVSGGNQFEGSAWT